MPVMPPGHWAWRWYSWQLRVPSVTDTLSKPAGLGKKVGQEIDMSEPDNDGSWWFLPCHWFLFWYCTVSAPFSVAARTTESSAMRAVGAVCPPLQPLSSSSTIPP